MYLNILIFFSVKSNIVWWSMSLTHLAKYFWWRWKVSSTKKGCRRFCKPTPPLIKSSHKKCNWKLWCRKCPARSNVTINNNLRSLSNLDNFTIFFQITKESFIDTKLFLINGFFITQIYIFMAKVHTKWLCLW